LDISRAEHGDGYCIVEVWGEARDIRVALHSILVRTVFNGQSLPIPVFVDGFVEGH
jgi:hypothetical protein